MASSNSPLHHQPPSSSSQPSSLSTSNNPVINTPNNGPNGTPGYASAYGNPYLHQQLPQQSSNSSTMVLPPRFPAGYVNNGTVPYHAPFPRSDTPTSQEPCIPPTNVYAGSSPNQSLPMRPGLPHASRMVAYPPQYYIAPGVAAGPMYMQGTHPGHYVYAPHPQHIGMRSNLHHMHSGPTVPPFMSPTHGTLGDQTLNAPNSGTLQSQQQNGTSPLSCFSGPPMPLGGNTNPSLPPGHQAFQGVAQNINKYGKPQAGDEALSESSQSSPYTKRESKSGGHRKKDSFPKVQNDYSVAQASPHSSSTSHDLSDARRLLSSSPGLSSSSQAALSNMTTASMNASSGGGKVNSQSHSASNSSGDGYYNVQIPAHITGSVRKLFTMGNEPERGPWLEEYLEFMRGIGKPLTTMPHVAKSHLDLYKLYHIVQENGGVMDVVKRRLWKDITQLVHVNASASATFTLRRNYVRYLLDYECHFALNGADPEPLADEIEILASKKKRKPSVPAGSSTTTSDLPPSDQCIDASQHFSRTQAMLSSSTNGSSADFMHYTNGGSTLNSLLCMAGGDGDSHSTSMSCPSASDIFHSQQNTIYPTAPPTCPLPTPPLIDSIPCDQSSEETATTNTDISMSKEISATSSETKDRSVASSSSKKQCFLDSVIDEVSSSSFNLPSRHQMSLPSIPSNVAPLDALLVSSSEPPSTIDSLLSSNETPQPPPSSCPSYLPNEFPVCNDSKNGLIGQSVRSQENVLRTPTLSSHRTVPRMGSPNVQNIRPEHRRLQGCLSNDLSQSLSSPPFKKMRTSVHSYPQQNVTHPHQASFSNHSVLPQSTGEVLPISSYLSTSFSSTGHESTASLDDSFSHPRHEKPSKTNIEVVKPMEIPQTFVKAEKTHSFPPESVECLKPSSSSLKRKRITEKELGSIDLWRVTMGLKSGLLAEVAWSIDCLTVLSFDSQTSQQLNLSQLPCLLDQLVDLFRHALWHAFPSNAAADSHSYDPTTEDCGIPISFNKGDPSVCRASDGKEDSQTTTPASKVNFSTAYSTLRDQRSNRTILIEPPREKDALANARLLELSKATTNIEEQETPTSFHHERKLQEVLKKSCPSPSVWPYLMDPLLHKLRPSDFSDMEHFSDLDLFVSHSLLQHESALARCVCLSTIIRNLSFLPHNEGILASHKNLLSLLGSLLMKQHSNKCTVSTEILSEDHQYHPFISLLLENSFITLIHLAGNMYLKRLPESIVRPILEGIIHWLVCTSSIAKAPLRNKRIRGRIFYRASEEHLSPLRLSLECLTRICVLEGNVDLILGTPTSHNIQRLFDSLAYNIAPGTEDCIVREMALRCLTYLCRGWEWLGTHFICRSTPSAISSLLTYLETTESRVQDIINKEGIDALRRNPEMIGTSLDLLRRVGILMENLGQIEANQQFFIDDHVARLLDLCTSRVLDHQVVRSLINLMHTIHKRGNLSNWKILCKRSSSHSDEEVKEEGVAVMSSRSKTKQPTSLDSHVTHCSSVLVMST